MEPQVKTVYRFVRSLREQAEQAHPSDYKKGYLTALADVEEFVADRAWDEGVDLEED